MDITDVVTYILLVITLGIWGYVIATGFLEDHQGPWDQDECEYCNESDD